MISESILSVSSLLEFNDVLIIIDESVISGSEKINEKNKIKTRDFNL